MIGMLITNNITILYNRIAELIYYANFAKPSLQIRK